MFERVTNPEIEFTRESSHSSVFVFLILLLILKKEKNTQMILKFCFFLALIF